MTRTLTPWARFPRSVMDWEFDFPRWMSRMLDEESGGDGFKFVPETNVVETDKAVEVTLDLPGLKPEDVKLEFEDGRLFVSGEKREVKEEKGETFHRMERRTGSFRRVISMPARVDESKIDATFEEGVLKICLPKSQEALPKAIPIKPHAK